MMHKISLIDFSACIVHKVNNLERVRDMNCISITLPPTTFQNCWEHTRALQSDDTLPNGETVQVMAASSKKWFSWLWEVSSSAQRCQLPSFRMPPEKRNASRTEWWRHHLILLPSGEERPAMSLTPWELPQIRKKFPGMETKIYTLDLLD